MTPAPKPPEPPVHLEECDCAECRALDRKFSGQGRQLRFPTEPKK